MRTGIAGFQPERLKQARQVVGMNKTVLADRLGCSVATVSKWESGQHAPQGITLAALSNIFKLPAHWFTQPVTKSGNTPYFFRTNAASTQTARKVAEIRLQWLQEISSIFQKWMNWPELNLPKLREEDLFQITDEQIEELAESCRTRWGLGMGPVSNVVQAMESAGIVCSRDSIGHVKMDGVSTWSDVDGRPYVLVVSDKANGIRNRFDAAHELGHLLMHSHIDKELYVQNYKLIEQQAHSFAAAFLMPEKSFLREVRRVTLDDLLILKSRWKVSVSAMIMRCYRLDLISDDDRIRLYKSLSARGWRRKEPLDDFIKPEEPKLLGRAAQMIINHGLYTKEALLNELTFDANNLERLCNLVPGFFMDTNDMDNVQLVNFKPKYGKVTSGNAEVVSFTQVHKTCK